MEFFIVCEQYNKAVLEMKNTSSVSYDLGVLTYLRCMIESFLFLTNCHQTASCTDMIEEQTLFSTWYNFV